MCNYARLIKLKQEEQANKPRVDSISNVIKRLGDELVATENLVNEGDPFWISRKDYYDNLYYIVTGKAPEKS